MSSCKMVREETRALGALLIYDEVYSFRMGYNGAQGELGVIPDLTALGKVIGGGHAHWGGRRLQSIDGGAVRSARRREDVARRHLQCQSDVHGGGREGDGTCTTALPMTGWPDWASACARVCANC